MMASKYAVGIDIGGTKISMVLGNYLGRILAHRTIPTRTYQDTSKCLAELEENLGRLIDGCPVPKKNILGIGVAMPGAVDPFKGVVPRSPHLGGWNGLPLRKILSSRFRLPVFMTNDANAGALAEKIFGSGRHAENFIYITVSTGIGGGIVVHGELIQGVNYVAGEVGHMTIVPDGERCKCGKKGCLEAYASGTAIGNYVVRQIRKGRKSIIPKLAPHPKKIRALDVSHAAKKGDRLALEAFQRAGYYLGLGIGNLLNVLNPQIIVLGGGVLKSAPPVFWRAIWRTCHETTWPEAMQNIRIMRTRLKGHVGDLGALALVFERFKIDKRGKR